MKRLGNAKWVAGAASALLLMALLLAGCGSSTGPAPGGQQVGALDNALEVGPYQPTDQLYRYRDIIDNLYIRNEPDGSYDGWYDQVEPRLVTYTLTDGPTLQGSINATGLKPHFAYQVKLEGQPTAAYLASTQSSLVKDQSNLRIGSVGRWWCQGATGVHSPKNVTDGDLQGGAHNNHMVLGYLLFDFFVTDVNGSATQNLYLDSSFHVLWRTDQRRPNKRFDGTTRPHRVTHDEAVYVSSFADQNVKVYAEGESGRPRPGDVALPAGDYECRLMLTEESFHNNFGGTSYPDGGLWAHALSDEGFQFTITSGTPTGGQLSVSAVDLSVSARGPFKTVTAQVTVVDESGFRVEGVTVNGVWDGISGANSAVTDGSGVSTLKSSKTKATGTATFTVTGLVKDGWTYTAPVPPPSGTTSF